MERCLLQPLACAVEDALRLQALEDCGDDAAAAAAAEARSSACHPLGKDTVQALLRLPPLQVAGMAVDVRDWLAQHLQGVLARGMINAPQDAHMYATMRSLAGACYGVHVPPLPPPPNDHGAWAGALYTSAAC